MLDAIGWLATAVFSASYFFRSGAALRRVQALAALLWIAYGFAISSKPVNRREYDRRPRRRGFGLRRPLRPPYIIVSDRSLKKETCS